MFVYDSVENLRSKLVAVPGDINESHNMNSELAKDRSDDIEIEDVGLRSLLRRALDRFGAGN